MPKPSAEDPVTMQLREVESRLIGDAASTGGVDETRVRAAVGEVAQRFADAPVRSFVPILVERAVREKLSIRPVRR